MAKKVLIVEDDFLLGLDLAQSLTDFGFEVVGPCGSVRDALARLKEGHCDAAVLDINLGRETSEPIAEVLTKEGIRFVVTSGYLAHQIPDALKHAPALSKPVQINALVALLEAAA